MEMSPHSTRRWLTFAEAARREKYSSHVSKRRQSQSAGAAFVALASCGGAAYSVLALPFPPLPFPIPSRPVRVVDEQLSWPAASRSRGMQLRPVTMLGVG